MNDITIVEGPSAVDPGPVHYHCTSLPASLFFNQTPKITPCRLTSFYEKNSLSVSPMDSSQPDEMKQSIVWSKVLFSCLLLLSGLFLSFFFFFGKRRRKMRGGMANLHIVMLRDTLPGEEGGILEMWWDLWRFWEGKGVERFVEKIAIVVVKRRVGEGSFFWKRFIPWILLGG